MDKNTLWYSLNRVRGLLDQQTILDLTIYALFLRKSEIDGLNARKEQYSLSWLSVGYGDPISVAELTNYMRDIETEYGVQDGIVSESFYNIALRITDSSKVKDIFRAVNNIDLSSDKILMAVYDEIIDQYVLSTGYSIAQHGSGRMIAKLEGALLNAEHGTEIYDGFCGFGISASEAGDETNSYYIRDIVRDVLAKAIITMIIHDRKNLQAFCGDSNMYNERKYRYAICEPPFGIRKDNEYIDRIRAYHDIVCNNSVDVEMIIGSLEEDGRAVILVPAGMLFSGGKMTDFRSYIVGRRGENDNYVEAVVSLPSGVIPGSGVSTALLVIDKGRKSDKIVMVNSESFWEGKKGRELTLSDDKIIELKDIVLSGKAVEAVSAVVTVDEIAEKDMNMTPQIYVNPYKIEEAKVTDLKELYAKEKSLMQKLSEVNSALTTIREIN